MAPALAPGTRRRRPAPRGAGDAAPRPAASPAPPPPAEPEGDPTSPFAPFAKVLGVAIPPPPADPDAAEPDAALEAAAARVLAHFQKNRPGPASAPSLSLRVLNLVATPNADMTEMVRLISADPALSAGLLTVANSVQYRGVQEIETVRAAVVRLGLEEVARVAGALAAKSLFNPKLKAEIAAHQDRFAALYHRSITVANGAAFVALQKRDARADRAFLGGLLHDVGRSVALRSVAALAFAGEAMPEGEALDRLLDRVHVEVGADCHQEWSMPQYLTVIAVRHHEPTIPAGAEFADLHAVRLASALACLREPTMAPRAAAEVAQSAQALAMDPYAVRSVDAELREAGQRAAAAFGIEPARR
ncbi:MAG: HDOD domain-containing protein [Anaeromyxobacter sp.]